MTDHQQILKLVKLIHETCEIDSNNIYIARNVYETGRGSKNRSQKSTRNTLHLVLDDYLPGDENRFLKKNCPEIITEHKISDLSQQFTKSDE